MSKSIFTPKRRKFTKAARRQIDAMCAKWHWENAHGGTNEMMGWSIRTGMVRRRIEAIAMETGVIPMGVIEVPDLPPGIIPGTYCSTNGIAGFIVDLGDLWQQPGRWVNVAQPRMRIVLASTLR